MLRVGEHVAALDSLLDSALNANVAQVGMRQNEDMRKISAWVAIAAVPTMLAGVYGMNFEQMPELSWTLGYPAAAGAHGPRLRAALPLLQAPGLAVAPSVVDLEQVKDLAAAWSTAASGILPV